MIFKANQSLPRAFTKEFHQFQHAQPLKLLHHLLVVVRGLRHVVDVIVVPGGRNAVNVVGRNDDSRQQRQRADAHERGEAGVQRQAHHEQVGRKLRSSVIGAF